ncbi:hypothetical protein EAX61_15185 [Dokdonia sinensis]|uniref:Heme oxygenase n=1 Tax=Dokdonia sinensis TaxID=2479847 RepID=A0A3M0G307_9FLAO|nr:biliverdin-producing heme oxygenase [Dokdonia sinensis]RMB56293.1 hypothetical protein EAX61_15185 [Dokdonia sinensis]
MILKRLKTETDKLHREVEEGNLAKYIMDGSITQPVYERLLRQNFEVYKAVEDCINNRYDVLPEELKPFAGYTKTNALAADIRGFSNLPLPQPDRLITPRKVLSLVGKMYVIEGSMVGVTMIAKKIQSCGALSHIEKHHFYNADSENSMLRWKKFKDAVASLKLSDDDMDTAVQSAKDTFMLFKKAFAKA